MFKAAGFPAPERRLYVRALGCCGRAAVPVKVRLDLVE
jgi:hypothetical protein